MYEVWISKDGRWQLARRCRTYGIARNHCKWTYAGYRKAIFDHRRHELTIIR